ncbi:MAG: peptidase M14 [Phycisphaerae bacterium]|nr:peptidase M14 [Phycisphaerae bacterium]
MKPAASDLLVRLGACIAACLAATATAQQQIDAKVDVAWNRYYELDEVEDMLRRLAAEHADVARLESIGTSVEGRPIWVFTINDPSTGPDSSKPAMYIDGSIHANEIQATETVLYSIWYLLEARDEVPAIRDLLARAAFYFVPVVNPDGRASWFEEPHTPHSSRTGVAPTDNDADGLLDEDGPNDLDGDGHIEQMWRKDPFGTHRRDPRDPRFLERVPTEPRADGTREFGEWSMAGQEGIDDDGDGEVNEDGKGGYDMNRNWPGDWRPKHVESGAGTHPLSYPETRAIAEFILARSNIAAGQAYHNTGGMILRGPGAADREGEYPARDRATYDAIARAGAEMLPFYRPLVIHSDLYTVHGGFVNWIAESLGIVSFTNELWTDLRILQNGQSPDEAQRRRWQDRVLFGRTWSDWQELPHPEYGTVLVGGGTKFSSRIPPPFMLEEECHRNFAFTAFHAEQMPLLRVESLTATRIGEDLWEVTIAIANDRLIPTRTARAAEKSIGVPDRLSLAGDGVEAVAAGPTTGILATTFEPVASRPSTLLVEQGIPGQGSRWFRFLVRAPEGASPRILYEAEKARDLEASIELR